MAEAALVLGSFAASYHGLALIALCQREHWLAVLAQRSRKKPGPALQARMKRRSLVLLSIGCALSLLALGPSFGGLLWVLSLGASAVALTFTLTWRSHWLKFLVPSGAATAARVPFTGQPPGHPGEN